MKNQKRNTKVKSILILNSFLEFTEKVTHPERLSNLPHLSIKKNHELFTKAREIVKEMSDVTEEIITPVSKKNSFRIECQRNKTKKVDFSINQLISNVFQKSLKKKEYLEVLGSIFIVKNNKIIMESHGRIFHERFDFMKIALEASIDGIVRKEILFKIKYRLMMIMKYQDLLD